MLKYYNTYVREQQPLCRCWPHKLIAVQNSSLPCSTVAARGFTDNKSEHKTGQGLKEFTGTHTGSSHCISIVVQQRWSGPSCSPFDGLFLHKTVGMESYCPLLKGGGYSRTPETRIGFCRFWAGIHDGGNTNPPRLMHLIFLQLQVNKIFQRNL